MKIALVGTRGVPARYGGFETCVDEVGRRLAAAGHDVVVYCRRSTAGADSTLDRYEGMRLVQLPALRAKSLETLSHSGLSALHIMGHRPDVAIVFNAANSIYLPLLRARRIPVATHVDGLEWKRAKWQGLGRCYYRLAEVLAVRWSDALIADARGIADYYKLEFGAASDLIAYGAPLRDSESTDRLASIGLSVGGYHLVVARFEPENHVDIIVEGYRRSAATLPLVVVGSAPYAAEHTRRIHSLADSRVRFLGAVWDQELLDQLYANALTYVHGHSVGGTNPSLLRAVGAGTATLAFDVNFNREVLGEDGRYFSTAAELSPQLELAEADSAATLERGERTRRIASRYDWDDVAHRYEQLCRRLATRSRTSRAARPTGRRHRRTRTRADSPKPEAPVVFVHSSDEIYGADRILLDLVSAVQDDVPVEVWLPTDVEHPEFRLCEVLRQRGVPVRHVDLPILRRSYRTPTGLLGLARRTWLLRSVVRKTGPRLVYCTTSAALLAAPVARRRRVPTVGHVQEIWSRSDRAVLTRLASSCDTIVAISEAAAEPLPPRLRQRTTVLLNSTRGPESPTLVGDHRGELSFLIASRWNGWKGHVTLLEAWDRARPNGQLVVLGGRPPSGESTDVPRLVAGLSNPGSVRIVGEVADVSKYLDSADVVVVPSDNPEPFGLVAIEAFAHGRPVIGSAAGGLADIVEDGVNGWLFPPGDSVKLAELLAGLDRESVTAAGLRARKTYESRYTPDRYGAEIARIVLQHPIDGPRDRASGPRTIQNGAAPADLKSVRSGGS